MSMLEVKDLQVYYGVIQALKGISFHVEQGEVIALIGANKRSLSDVRFQRIDRRSRHKRKSRNTDRKQQKQHFDEIL